LSYFYRQLIYAHFYPFLGTGIAWEDIDREETKPVVVEEQKKEETKPVVATIPEKKTEEKKKKAWYSNWWAIAGGVGLIAVAAVIEYV